MRWTCLLCKKPLKRINFHNVECRNHDFPKQHRLCGVCVPVLVDAEVIRWHNPQVGHVMSQDDSCPSRELLTAVRLM
jgi:hypothetical protein